MALASVAAPVSAKMNVLFIMSDDMRPELAGPWGLPWMHTPNIQRLAKQGTTFSRAYCQVAVCAPSRTSLLTGIYNDYARVWTIGPYFRKSMAPQLAAPNALATIPQHFKESGYNASGFGKIFHQGGPSGGEGGLGGGDAPFSWSESYWFCDQYWTQIAQSPASAGWPFGPGPGKAQGGTGCVQTEKCIACLRKPNESPGTYANGSLMGLGSVVSWSSADCPDNCYPDGLVGDAIVAQLKAKAANPAQPFFLAAGFKRPHLGFYAPKWAYDLYPSSSIQLAKHRMPPSDMPAPAWCDGGSMGTFNDTKSVFEERHIPTNPGSPFSNFSGKFLPDAKHIELRRGYYASVSLVDKQLGRILDVLESTGLRNNTIITFTGDHGFQLGEHGEWGKFTNFELGTRVPLMISLPPGIQRHPGSVVSAPTMLLDVFPTLVAAAGLQQPPQKLSGVSLLPLMAAPSTVPNGMAALSSSAAAVDIRGFAFSEYPRNVRGTHWMGMSMRTERWRFTEWCQFNYTSAYPEWSAENISKCELELYDHQGDTGTDPSAIDDFDNANLAYLPAHAATVAALHKQIIAEWDGGVMPPPGPAPHPHPHPHPEPAPPQPAQGKAGFLKNGQLCVGAGDAGGKCANGGFSVSTCSAKSAVWRQMPTGIQLVSEPSPPSKCLNLYGGGKAGTCKNGTAIHASLCRWSAKGDRWLATKDGQLKLDVAKGGACAGVCAKVESGCLAAGACGGEGTAGWEIAPAGGSWE